LHLVAFGGESLNIVQPVSQQVITERDTDAGLLNDDKLRLPFRPQSAGRPEQVRIVVLGSVDIEEINFIVDETPCRAYRIVVVDARDGGRIPADHHIHGVLLFCLLSGMRAGEAAGLVRDDLVSKGNLGTFAHVRPNALRELKTDASERLVPVHSVLEDLLATLPAEGALFPDLTVNIVTKRFADLRRRLDVARPGLVFHSTRKWFITQCERTGVPEHFTASIVGHQSARSENKLTYSIYSAGISDEQKRAIVDQIRLPVAA